MALQISKVYELSADNGHTVAREIAANHPERARIIHRQREITRIRNRWGLTGWLTVAPSAVRHRRVARWAPRSDDGILTWRTRRT